MRDSDAVKHMLEIFATAEQTASSEPAMKALHWVVYADAPNQCVTDYLPPSSPYSTATPDPDPEPAPDPED